MEEQIARFLEAWNAYSKELFWYVDYDSHKVMEDITYMEKESKVAERAKFLFSESKNIRRFLFLLGEENLSVTTIYQWNELKAKHPKIAEVGFVTPFGYLSYWVSLPHIHFLVEDHGFREALFVSEYFIEALGFKYPKLAKD